VRSVQRALIAQQAELIQSCVLQAHTTQNSVAETSLLASFAQRVLPTQTTVRRAAPHVVSLLML